VFAPDRLFQPSLMFTNLSRACPSQAPFRCSTLVQASGLTQKYYTRLEKPVGKKHSSLLGSFMGYKENKTSPLIPDFHPSLIVEKRSEPTIAKHVTIGL
jgi:hypothetical protein